MTEQEKKELGLFNEWWDTFTYGEDCNPYVSAEEAWLERAKLEKQDFKGQQNGDE